nr:hypothetical protein [Tanacetum cinerariifolium]
DARRRVPVFRRFRKAGAQIPAQPARRSGATCAVDRRGGEPRDQSGGVRERQDQGRGAHRFHSLGGDHRDHAGHGG